MILENICVLHADIILPSGRLYPLRPLRDTLKRYKDVDILGQIGQPKVSQEEQDNGMLKNVLEDVAFSSKLKSIVDNQLLADITILTTPKGNWFKEQLISGNITNPTFRIVALVHFVTRMEVEIVQLLQINYISNPV